MCPPKRGKTNLTLGQMGCAMLLGVVLILLAFVEGWSGWVRGAFGIIGALIVIGIPGSAIEERVSKRRAVRKFQEEVVSAVEQHATTLLRKHRQLVRVDDYGNTIVDAWEREVEYFIARVITPLAGRPLNAAESAFAHSIMDQLLERASYYEEEKDVGTMSPTEYEHYCADLLREVGWEARVTAASGDQGVDIVATRDGETLVVQAKRYSGSVGNAAVQEAIAGKEFIGADKAAVVSPATFTRSAIELANTTGVLLLHHEQLAEL